MVFTKDSDDFQVLRFSGKCQKNRNSGQKFDAKIEANSGQKCLENPMQKIMEFHEKSMEFPKKSWKIASGPVFLAISWLLATFSCHEARCRGPMPRGNGHEAARGTWQVARGPWQVDRCIRSLPSPQWQRLLDIVADI